MLDHVDLAVLVTNVTSAAVVCAVSFLLAAAIVPLVRRLARGSGLYEQPVADRWHLYPVPKLGGVAIATAFFPIAWLFAGTDELRALVVATGLMFGLGLFDDLRPIRPLPKFTSQVATAALFLYFAPGIDLTGLPALDLALSLAWFVGVTNAFNLLDNIDGLAAGAAAIAGCFLAWALVAGPIPAIGLALAAAALAGVALGFLLYNWHPATIFMGDGGSQLLGAFFAGATLLAIPNLHSGPAEGATMALLLMLVPCADTAFVILTRRLESRSVLVGGRDHLSHRIVALGANERQAVLVLYLAVVTGGAVALGFQGLDATVAWWLAAAWGVVVLVATVYLSHVRAAGTARPPGLFDLLPGELTQRRPVFHALLDTALIAGAYYLGLVTRFPDPRDFETFLAYFVPVLPLVLFLHLAAMWLVGKYRRRPRSSFAADLGVILRGGVLGAALTVTAVLFLTRFDGYSRQAFATGAGLVVVFMSASNAILRGVDEAIRRRAAGPRALVYGAGVHGELAVRELANNPTLGLVPLGVIDDDPTRRRERVEGYRILGTLEDLERILTQARGAVTTVIISVPSLPPDRYARLRDICAQHAVEVRQLRFSLDDVPVDRREGPAAIVRFPQA